MTAMEYINAHREDEDSCECIILPDGAVSEPVPSHIGCLMELAGKDAASIHERMEKNMEPLFWLVEYTGCLSVWQTRVVGPSVITGAQQDSLDMLHDAALLSAKYLLQQADERYTASVDRARKEIG